MSGAILVVEDEATLAKNLKTYLLRQGFDVKTVASGEEALAEFDTYKPDALLLDFNLPKMSGLDVLEQVKLRDPRVKVVMITGHGNEQIAVDAMKAGAYDYLTKPVMLGKIKLVLDKALGQEKLEGALSYIQKKSADESGLLLGQSHPMRDLKEMLRHLAESECKLTDGDPPAVLITGETGTGKELVARALHFDGPRRERPFIELNCASIPTQLLEAELFGYERGAFTDARERKLGLAEAAEGGTLFLDEIGDLDLSIQAKLLKLLEDKMVRRLGSVRDQPVNVRIVAATNRDLEAFVRDGKFRSDLYFRLSIIRLHLPSLRARADDIPMLAQHFLDKHCARYGKKLRFDDGALIALGNYAWPGNVRELRNAMEQVVLMARSEIVSEDQLPILRNLTVSAEHPASTARTGEASPTASKSLEQVEREMLVQALERAGWNVTRAARMLAVSRDTMRYRIEKHGLHRQH